MVEEYKYQDKSVWTINEEGSLQNLVNKEFTKINSARHRDDQEILNAWWNVCNTLISQIQKDKSMVYWPWALQPLTDLSNELKQEYNAIEKLKRCKNNADKIYEVANKIDDAERQTLIRLQMNKTAQDSRDIVKKSQEKDKKNPMFTMELNSNNKETWNLVFTKASNPVNIQTALEWLFDDPNKVYQIDYSNCKHEKIKNKMTSLTWTKTCYLRYDKDQGTYTIRDQYGKWITDRAYIREWVKLIPDWVRQWWAYQEQKKEDEIIWKIDQENISTDIKNMLRDMPSLKKISSEQQKKLFIKTEERILELLKNAKKLWYELHSECVSKVWTNKWLMEVHFISWTSERDEVFWNDNKIIWPELYNFLDWEEWEYKTYLTNRIKQKWQELGALTKTETININKEWDDELIESKEEKQRILYWMWLLETMIDKYRENEGNSRADNDDKQLVQIKKILRDWRYSIENSDSIWKNAIIANIIDAIRKNRANIKKIYEMRQESPWYKAENDTYTQQYNYLKNVFFWTKNEQLDAIRELWSYARVFNKTETSFLQQEIENDVFEEEEAVTENGEPIYKNKFQVEDDEINKYIDRIYQFNIKLDNNLFDEKWNLNEIWQQKVKSIDELYAKAKENNSKFVGYLIQIWLLPKYMDPRNVHAYSPEIVKPALKLKEKLNSIQQQIDHFPTTLQTLAESNHKEKLRLEQKNNKTEEDLQRLQALEYLEQHPDERDKMNEVTINTMKTELQYWWFAQWLGSCLFEPLTQWWWWAKMDNANIYNDITWYWFRDLSDQNAKIAWEILAEIAITVAVCVITWGAWMTIMGAALRGTARLAKSAKWVNLANKIVKIVEISQKWYRALSTTWKIIKFSYTAMSLIPEAMAFNAASDAIHSAINWTSLDSLDFNPISKKNVQTAAFLWALSVSSKLAWTVMKAWWATKVSINPMKWLEKAHLQAPLKFPASLVTEMGSMLAAEQAVNFVFWHDVVNPETWEIETSRKPEFPTQQELIQMVGMILAFKVAKPTLWPKLAEKLNEWTLRVCRETTGKGIVIVDPATWKIVERINESSVKENSNTWTRWATTERWTTTEKQNKSNDKVRDKATEQLYENFDQLIMSENWITIDWITYKLERKPAESQNPGKKWTVVYTETWPDWKSVKYTVQSKTFVVPESANWGNIRKRFEAAREKYINKNMDSAMQSAKWEISWQLTTDINSKVGDLEYKKRTRESLEWEKKTISDEIDWLKSQRSTFEEQLQTTPKETTLQPETISLNDIYSILSHDNVISTKKRGKCKFIDVKWNKMRFKDSNWKLREFSSFKELSDAWANFNIDIKSRQWEKWLEKQIKFEELVEREAKLQATNEVIRKYEKLQQQRAEVENDIKRNSYFRDKADHLVWEHIWIDGVEYQCTEKHTNNGRTTLDFKQTDWPDHFTISSFAQLNAKWSVRWFWDRNSVQNKNRRAAWRELSRAERKHDNFLQELFNWEKNHTKNKTQELQEIDQQLQNTRADYDNAKLANSPKKVPNSEYERIQREIEWIDKQLAEKWEKLTSIEKDLWISEAEITTLEKEIADLTAEKDALSRTNEVENMNWNPESEGWSTKKVDIDPQIRENSQKMDKIRSEINPDNEKTKIQKIREEISKQYTKATWKELKLTDEQIRSILTAHKQKWKLWEIGLNELRRKNTILAETIADPEVRRFLFESWFCGEFNNNVYRNYIESSSFNAENSKWQIEELEREMSSLDTQIKSIERLRNEKYPERKTLSEKLETLKSQEKEAKTTAEKLALNREIKSVEDQIRQFDKQHPQTWLEKEQKQLESYRKNAKTRKESLEKAVKFTEAMNKKFDPKLLNEDISKKQSDIEEAKIKLETAPAEEKPYIELQIKKLQNELKKLEKTQKAHRDVHELLTNADKTLNLASMKERLSLRWKRLTSQLKSLYYNTTKNWQKIAELKTEIKDIESKIHQTNIKIEDILKTTYSWLRDLKWLNDAELMQLVHDYQKNILEPIKFTVINPSKTFSFEYVGNDFITQRTRNILFRGERLNTNNFEAIRKKLTEVRLWDFESFKNMKDIETFINENFPQWTAERDILTNLEKSLKENFDIGDKRLSEADRSVIFSNSVSYMLDYMEAHPNKPLTELYEILDINQNKLVHQHVQDKHFLTWSSHDVLHILRWNMNMAENFMTNMSPVERVLVRQIIIDHDMWYTSMFNHILSWARSDVFFGATKDHPLRSAEFIETNKDWYINNFGEKWYETIRNSVVWHSKADTKNLPIQVDMNSPLRAEKINAVISVVDCVAASTDYKSAFLFWRPEVSWEFMSVYTAMNEWKIDIAINELHKIVETAKTIPDQNLRSSIMDALNSLHLIDPKTGNSTLDTRLKAIDQMDASEIQKARDNLLTKLTNKDKFLKNLNIFCKANGIDTPKWKEFDLTLERIQQDLPGINDPEMIKNYLKYDYINDRVSFPYKKYLSQYWVRVSRKPNWETMIECGNTWTIEATFELAGKSFEILLDKWRNNFDLKWWSVADFALESFLKVCDDMNVDIKKGPQIKELKEHINNRVKDHNNQSISEYLKEKYQQDFVIIKWKNWEKITLKFEWNSYEWFDRIINWIDKINAKINDIQAKIESHRNNPELLKSLATEAWTELSYLWWEIQKDCPELNKEKRDELTWRITQMWMWDQYIPAEDLIKEINNLREQYYFNMGPL